MKIRGGEIIKLSHLNWEAFAGFALPILLCWFSLAWMIGVSIWLSDLSFSTKSDWLTLFIVFTWLTYVPLISYAMGILSAYCWKNQQWGHYYRSTMVNTFSACLWAVSFPLAILLVCSLVGLIVFPIQMTCYERGVKLGEGWARNRDFEKFLGKENDWERDEDIQ